MVETKIYIITAQAIGCRPETKHISWIAWIVGKKQALV